MRFNSPLLLIALMTMSHAVGQEIQIGYLSREQLSLELAPIQQRIAKEATLAKARQSTAESRLAKFLDLEQKGFASPLEVQREESRLKAAKSSRAMWQILTKAVLTAQDETDSSDETPFGPNVSPQVPFQIPGVTQRYGNIDLFTLTTSPDSAQLDSAIRYLGARQVPTMLGQNLGEIEREYLSGLHQAVQKLESPYASDTGRLTAKAVHAASNVLSSVQMVDQLKRDADRVRKFRDTLDSGQTTPFPWLSQPLGLMGMGWKCSASPSPRVINLCLPIAAAQRDHTGHLQLAKARLALAKHRQACKEQAHAREAAGHLEVEGAEVTASATEAYLDASVAIQKGNQIRYQLLHELAPAAPTNSSLPPLNSLDDIEDYATSALQQINGQPAFVYGWLRNLESWLAAWIEWESAARIRSFREAYRDKILSLRKSTENERQRVSLETDVAAAILLVASENLELRKLEFAQWIDAAALAQNPGFDTGPRIPSSAVKSFHPAFTK